MGSIRRLQQRPRPTRGLGALRLPDLPVAEIVHSIRVPPDSTVLLHPREWKPQSSSVRIDHSPRLSRTIVRGRLADDALHLVHIPDPRAVEHRMTGVLPLARVLSSHRSPFGMRRAVPTPWLARAHLRRAAGRKDIHAHTLTSFTNGPEPTQPRSAAPSPCRFGAALLQHQRLHHLHGPRGRGASGGLPRLRSGSETPRRPKRRGSRSVQLGRDGWQAIDARRIPQAWKTSSSHGAR